MDIQVADSRPVTISNGTPQAAVEFHALSLQISENDARPSDRRHRTYQASAHKPRWHALLYTLLPLHTAHQQHEAEELQRDAALLQVANELQTHTYHLDSINAVYAQLGADPVHGLRTDEAVQRTETCGCNVVSPAPRRLLSRAFGWVFGGFNRFLWPAMIVFWLCWKPIGNPPQSGNLAMAVVIILVICLQALFSAWQEWTTDRTMHSITNMVTAETHGLRNGLRVQLAQSELVPGDIVFLRSGDRVPADVRLVQVSMDVLVDRSELSGAPDPTIGTTGYTNTNYLETRNMAMMGMHIAQGQCTGVVVATGDRTVLGRIGQLVTHNPADRTILQIEVQRLVNWLTTVSLVVGTLFVVLWAVWLRPKYPGFMSVSDALANGVGVLVTFVPGSLPISLILAMTMVAKRMQRYKLLVKNLTTVETLGTVTVICCEKTGTVTQRRMVPTRIGFGDAEFEFDALVGACEAATVDALDVAVRRVHETAALCNAARFDPTSAHLPINGRVALGDATDCALLRMAEHLCPLQPARRQYDTLLTVPFNLRRRWMLAVCADRTQPTHSPFMLVKGAPETLLPKCTRVQLQNGDVVPLDHAQRARIEEMQHRWAAQDGCRVLLLCRREYASDECNPLAGVADSAAELYAVACQNMSGLCVVGLVGLIDPPRDEILDSVGKFRGAGIRVFMVTGDYAPTAAFVARQCGIITSAAVDGIDEINAQVTLTKTEKRSDDKERRRSTTQSLPKAMGGRRAALLVTDSEHTLASRSSLVVSGPDLHGLGAVHWDIIAQYDECVFARITPEQKLQVVEEMRGRGHIVAVTGDEVNDVPAMRAAHVGVAMGNGTQVAKAASGVVLLDNNFSSLVVAIECGRLLFINLKKVIVYLLPMTNLSEIVPSLLNVTLGLPIPLSTFLMLVINTVTDVWASVVLIYEEPETDLMLHPPRNSSVDGLVNVRFFLQAYGFVGLVQTLTGHIMFFLCLYLRGGIHPRDVFLSFNKWTDGYLGKSKAELAELVSISGSAHFMALVVMQWANMFVARTRVLSVFRQNPFWGPRRNPMLLVAIPIAVAVSLVVNEFAWFNSVFLTGKIPVEFFFLPIPFALALLVLEELRKLVVRRYPNGGLARIAW
ncbi:hypothetical protein IWW56_003959 [Coemansia sp. RSA 2131]|nr:hypothetical protein IWW56_003959 [Coemansia sp. RSA 2131]